MFHLVYKITNKVNHKFYVGYHKTSHINDSYMGSGKLILRAIKKHGIDNFSKEILLVSDSKEAAEELEAFIVDDEFILRDDTYNLVTGGNICSLPGVRNPMYGVRHPDELIKQITNSSKLTRDLRGFGRQYKLFTTVNKNGTKTFNKQQVKQVYSNKFYEIILEKINEFEYIPDELIELCNTIMDSRANNILAGKEKLSRSAKLRFTGVQKTPEHKQKIKDALTGVNRPYVGETTNKNPEKIRKTAEKHRGMKRTESTKENISLAKLSKNAELKLTTTYSPSRGKYRYVINHITYINPHLSRIDNVIILCRRGNNNSILTKALFKKFPSLFKEEQIGTNLRDLGFFFDFSK